VAVGRDRDEEDFELTKLVVLDAVDALRKRWVRATLEDERERRAAARLAGNLRHLDELALEGRRSVGGDPKGVVEQRAELVDGEFFEHARKATVAVDGARFDPARARARARARPCGLRLKLPPCGGAQLHGCARCR